MPVVSELCLAVRSWTGAESQFPTGFVADQAADCVVKTASTTLLRGTHYTSTLDVNGQLVITPLPAMPAAPQTLTIERSTPAVQPDDIAVNDTYSPLNLERRLNQSAMRDAEIKRRLEVLANSMGPPIQLFNPRGYWNSVSSYLKGDAVYLDGASYIAIMASSGVSPSVNLPMSWQLIAKGYDLIMPDDPQFGGKCNDPAFDNTAAVNAAMAAAVIGGYSKVVYLKPGIWRVDGPCQYPSNNGLAVFGEGENKTILESYSTTAAILKLFAGGTGQLVRGLHVRRAAGVVPVAGANGIETPVTGNVGATIIDCVSNRNWNGFVFGCTAFSQGRNLKAEHNRNDNYQVTNGIGALNGSQWNLKNLYGGNAGRDNLLYIANALATGGMACGDLVDFYGFGAGRNSVGARGLATCPIQSVRGNNWFGGQDGASTFFLDTYGVNHRIDNTFAEAAGTYPNGVDSLIPPTGVGHGWEITANNNDVTLDFGKANGASQANIKSATPYLKLVNINATYAGFNNASTAPVDSSGVYISAGELHAHDLRSGLGQDYGIWFEQDGNHHVTGSDLSNNTTLPIGSAVVLTNITLDGNVPKEVRTNELRPPEHRLSLQSGKSVMDANQVNVATLYSVPHTGRRMPLFTGAAWCMVASDQVARAANDATYSPAAGAVDKVYHWLAWWRPATREMIISPGPAWVSDTNPGTGAGSSETEINALGLEVNKFAITNGPAAGRGLVIGVAGLNVSALFAHNILDVDTSPVATSAQPFAGVWNKYNRVQAQATFFDATASWSLPASTTRIARATARNSLILMRGQAAETILTHVQSELFNPPVADFFSVGIGLNGSSASGRFGKTTVFNGSYATIRETDAFTPGIGRHTLNVLERSNGQAVTVNGGRAANTSIISFWY